MSKQSVVSMGALALVRYYTKKSSAYLYIGSGFIGAGLLDAYHAAGGSQTVTLNHVRGQELSLMLDWLAVGASPQDNDEALSRLRSLLKRLKA